MSPANIDPSKIHTNHQLDSHGSPIEGTTWGRGFHICWANPASSLKVPDGAIIPTIIKAAKDRLELCNKTTKSAKYAEAIAQLEAALKALE